MQKVFESIRKVGATGKHLSKGERSLLDAFQSAAVRNAERGIDALVPIYDFYPSIESFIDTSAKRSIDEAPANLLLESYDVQLLKALFLIRYIPDIIKPNVDNLATLCVDQIDADKLALRRRIQESLTRLEHQRLVSRNGDLWKPEWEVVLLIARLFMAGEIKLMLEGSDLDPKSAAGPLTKSVRFKQVSILKRKSADAGLLKRARDLHKEIFSKLGREDEDGLVADYRASLGLWQAEMKEFSHTAATRHHPGKQTIDQALSRIAKQLAVRDSFEFIETILANKDAWLDASEDIHDLTSFYKNQIATWQRMLEALQRFEPNRAALTKEPQAASALQQLAAIRDNPTPYQQINQIEPLIQSVEAVNAKLVDTKREHALLLLEKKMAKVNLALDQAQAPPDLRNRALHTLQQIKLDIAAQTSIPQILYAQDQAGTALDSAMDMISVAVSAAVKPQPPAVKAPGDSSTVIHVGHTQAAQTVAPKPAKVIRAADLSSSSYLETEAEVEEYLAKLKAELLAAIKAGQRARIQ